MTIIYSSDFEGKQLPNPEEISRANVLLTDLSTLQVRDSFPIRGMSLEDLFRDRFKVRDLELLPLKDDKTHDLYNSLDREMLAGIVRNMMRDEKLALAPNLYPYDLPSGVDQSILWIANPDESRASILAFIVNAAKRFEISLDDLILFERPVGNMSRLIKGTLPQIRHVHFWNRRDR